MSFIKSKWQGSKFEEKLKEEKTDRILEPALPLSGLRVKVIEIGGWDMDFFANKSVVHGMTMEKIRMVTAIITPDDLSYTFDITCAHNGGVAAGRILILPSSISMTRLNGDFYDDVAFDDATINRGWVTIWYEA